MVFPLSPEQLQVMLNEGETLPPARLCWMAEYRGAIVGHAQLGFDWRNGNATLSRVAVAPECGGEDLARPMLSLIIRRAFSFAEIERLELNVFAWNTPAVRTYERLGFKVEGVRRSSALVTDVRWDTAIMIVLRWEWSGLPAR